MTEPVWRDAAIALDAVDAVLCDGMTPEAAIAFARRRSEGCDTDPIWANGRHQGDCTKTAHSCLRCQVEEYEAEARRRYET